MRDMPSFQEVMAMEDVKVEVLSLLPVVVNTEDVVMTKDEVEHLIWVNGATELSDAETVPGRDEEFGVFEELF